MSLDIPPIHPEANSSEESKSQAWEELLHDFSPAKKLSAVFLLQIQDMKSERGRIVEENNKIQERMHSLNESQKVELESLGKFKIAHARLYASRTEHAVSSVVALLLSGGGGALMGIFPRSENNLPWQFCFGAAAVAIGVIIGVVGRVCALGIRKFFPGIIDDGFDK